eukprot:TRINITY_DN13036_c0_g1_i1.p1 TRINITY_DN13036_c0_g1~~TRINITY_DN13036_c0_g1_i1.p1  ORF type:complete len:244 (-),score=7.70 TRINITY_DN13036_c0_g1_i1:706-1437(-)
MQAAPIPSFLLSHHFCSQDALLSGKKFVSLPALRTRTHTYRATSQKLKHGNVRSKISVQMMLADIAMPQEERQPSKLITSAVPEELEVYVAMVKLDVPAGLPSFAYNLGANFLPPLFQHSMVLLKKPSEERCVLFDFRPQDPTDPLVALRVLTGQPVPGSLRERNLEKLPNRRCWFIGTARAGGVEAARSFNSEWETDLQVFRHDCRHHTARLVESLTGRPGVLRDLQNLQKKPPFVKPKQGS